MYKVEKFYLEKRKGVFVNEWLDCVDKPNNTEQLPKEAFYSKLKQSSFKDIDYQQALVGQFKTR